MLLFVSINTVEPIDPFSVDRFNRVIHFAGFIFPKREYRKSGCGDPHILSDFADRLVELQRPDFTADEVRVKIQSLQFGQSRAAVDKPAGDGLANLMVVFPDRGDRWVNEWVSIGFVGNRQAWICCAMR